VHAGFFSLVQVFQTVSEQGKYMYLLFRYYWKSTTEVRAENMDDHAIILLVFAGYPVFRAACY
jgi:hypothetical protein